MNKFVLLFLIFLPLSSPSKANGEPIDEMFNVMSMDKQLTAGFDAMSPMLDQLAVKFNLNKEGKDELQSIFRDWFNEDIDREKIMSEVKNHYKKIFTNSEINQITNFYKTPIGKKLLDKSPQLMKFGVQLGIQEAQLKQAKLTERMEPFLKKFNIE